MRLLLDEMWSPTIAQQLRHRGFDIVAVAERLDLRTAPDGVIFATAQAEGRAIVTENAKDFRPFAIAGIERGDDHAGLILTDNHHFPRHDPRVNGRLVNTLLGLLNEFEDIPGLEWWLG